MDLFFDRDTHNIPYHLQSLQGYLLCGRDSQQVQDSAYQMKTYNCTHLNKVFIGPTVSQLDAASPKDKCFALNILVEFTLATIGSEMASNSKKHKKLF